LILPVRIHNSARNKSLLTSLRILLNGYPGRVRMIVPPLAGRGGLEGLLEGLVASEDKKDIASWAQRHVRMIARNQKSTRPYDAIWAEQRVLDVRNALEKGMLLEAKNRNRVALGQFVMEPQSYHTVFLAFDRPRGGKPGSAHEIEVHQIDDRSKRVIGGLSARVELVPEPKKALRVRSR
jgi:hypothetical protein